MSCEHAETTTLLWLSGELDPVAEAEVLGHIARCAACQEVVRIEEQVAAAVVPLAPILRGIQPVSAPPIRANRPLWAIVLVVAAAAAAVAVLFSGSLGGSGASAARDTDVAVLSTSVDGSDGPLFGDVDAGLEALDFELADLSYDLTTL